jgi:gliding motility-associated-like protein
MQKFTNALFIVLLSIPHLLFAHTGLPMSNTFNVSGRHSYAITNSSNNNNFAPQPITICSGASIVVKGDTQNPVPDTYTWELLQNGTWVNAPGINNGADYPPTLLVNNTSNNILFDIRRKTVTAGVTAYDSFYDVTVLTAAPITNNVITSPAVAIFCSTGSPAIITGSVPAGGLGGIVYQWQSSTDNVTFTDISGANGLDYTPGVLTATTYFRRVVSGGCSVASVSNTISITVLSGVTNNTVTAPAPNSFCVSGDPAVIAGNTPTGGTGLYTYQWQSSTDAVNFTDITGATGKDYDPPVISTTMFYRRLVATGICTVPVYSNVVIINILPTVSNNNITAPAVTSFCITGSPSAITGSIPTGGNGGYTYQWQSSIDNITFTNIPLATLKDYAPATIIATTYYRRIVISGSCVLPLTSNVVTISITPLPTAPTLAPTSTTICPGSVATFSIVNAQTGAIYNWYDSPAKINLLFTGITYVSPPMTASAILYIENSNGSCASASSTVQITVLAPPVAPALVNSTITTCPGTSATLTVANPQPGYTYNWYASATGGTAISTGISFTTPALSASTTYYVEAINVAGCNSTSRTAGAVNMPAADPIIVQDASICPGTTATLSATTASNATINWYTSPTGGSPIYTGNTFTTATLIADTHYYVEAVSTTGCVPPARTLVQAQILQQLPAPVVTVDGTTASSVSFKWPAVTGATGYLVSIDNGLTYISPSSGSTGLSHTVSGLQLNQKVTILVQATGTTVCQLSTAASATGVAVNQAEDIYVANAFTPNGDGKNDFVYVRSQSIKNLKFYVYSQWGELLFSSTDVSSGWDGTYRGAKEPVGVYVYYLVAEMLNGQEVSKKGTITLLK